MSDRGHPVPSSLYVELTRSFNSGRMRAVLFGGQAVVMHRLAVMSKDGDWLLREDQEALSHVLEVLESRGARYRFGAPLALEWLRHGWSSHFEFTETGLRVRADFFTRPPRLSEAAIEKTWNEATTDRPVVGAIVLAESKKTNREKDYAVIGELARVMPDAVEQLRYSRSVRDIRNLARQHPEACVHAAIDRPFLAELHRLDDIQVGEALDRERRDLMAANERRIVAYLAAAEPWRQAWPKVENEVRSMPLKEAHAVIARRAHDVLPTQVHL